MKSKNLHLIKFFFVMMFLVIFLALLILGFCWFFYLLPIDFPGTVGDWIAGLSALAGGALTLGGVWWTINNQKEEKGTELELLYKPILKISQPQLNEEKQVEKNSINNKTILNIMLCIENIGRGEAIDIEVTYSKAMPSQYTGINITECLEFDYIKIYTDEIGFLPSGKLGYLCIELPISEKYENADIFSFNINLQFKNVFSNTTLLKHQARIMIKNNDIFKISKNEKYFIDIKNIYKN